jgi:hypothetical protein
LRGEGVVIGREMVRTMMRRMCIEAMYLSSDIRNPAVGDIENPATSVMLMSRSKPLRL